MLLLRLFLWYILKHIFLHTIIISSLHTSVHAALFTVCNYKLGSISWPVESFVEFKLFYSISSFSPNYNSMLFIKVIKRWSDNRNTNGEKVSVECNSSHYSAKVADSGVVGVLTAFFIIIDLAYFLYPPSVSLYGNAGIQYLLINQLLKLFTIFIIDW